MDRMSSNISSNPISFHSSSSAYIEHISLGKISEFFCSFFLFLSSAPTLSYPAPHTSSVEGAKRSRCWAAEKNMHATPMLSKYWAQASLYSQGIRFKKWALIFETKAQSHHNIVPPCIAAPHSHTHTHTHTHRCTGES